MSLTSEIADRSSLLSGLLDAHFTELKPFRAACRATKPKGRNVVIPEWPEGSRVPHGTLGAAVDHRLRRAFSNDPKPSGAVMPGIGMAARSAASSHRDVVQRVGRELLDELERLTVEHQPFDRTVPMLLDPVAEERLVRICYAMVWFEEVFRTGQMWPGTTLGDAGPDLTLEMLLDGVPAAAVSDVTKQMALAHEVLTPLRIRTDPSAVVCGPTFDGSLDVGGADADLIVDGVLLDIKATATPGQLTRNDILQLIGYALLDYSDQFRIHSVGFYFSRLGWLVEWPLSEYMALLGCRIDLSELRQRWCEILDASASPTRR